MVAGSTYAQARTYSIQAATDLFSAASPQVTAVTNAWNAVGVTTGAARVAATATASPAVAANASLSGVDAAARGLSLYPVPATNELHLQLGGNAEILSVRVTDLRGAAVNTARYNGEGVLDVSGLAKGMYLVSVSNGQETFRQRFVKE